MGRAKEAMYLCGPAAGRPVLCNIPPFPHSHPLATILPPGAD